MAKKNPFEGSPKDMKEDKAGAKKAKMPLAKFEKSPMDAKLDAKGAKAIAKPKGKVPYPKSR